MENLKKDTKTEVLKAYVLAVNEMKNPANVAENPFHKSKYAPLVILLFVHMLFL